MPKFIVSDYIIIPNANYHSFMINTHYDAIQLRL